MDTATRERLFHETLVPALEAEDQFSVRRIAFDYSLDFEEIRHLARAARDLEMWREASLAKWWSEAESDLPGDPRRHKRALLAKLDAHLEQLRTGDKVYPTEPLRGLTRGKAELVDRTAPTKVFTLCPFFSKDANCCGLHTIEAVSGCALGCSFCPVSANLGDRVEFSTDLRERLSEVRLDPNRFYHVSTGQFSDSLAWGNRHGILDALFEFARNHANVQLELKTKSDRIDYLLKHEVPDNILCTWLLNTDTMIRNEEHATATLRRRLQAARAVADKGNRIGFHINPVIQYSGWRGEYTSLAGQLLAEFSPEELVLLSIGVVSFTPPVVREIRRRGGESKVLQMPLVSDPLGKLTYPYEQRVELYSAVYGALQPWHGKVFIYLCMETSSVWEAVLGKTVAVQQELERIFNSRLLTSAA